MIRWTASTSQSLVDAIYDRLNQEHSKRQIKSSLESNACHLNGQVERFASRRVKPGDEIQFDTSCLEKTPLKEVKVLYEDEHLLAIDKPAGLRSEYSDHYLVHRLDRYTTGVLLFAKTKKAQKKIEELFRQRQVEKSYLALVDGRIKEKTGVIRSKIGKVGEYEGQTIWGETEEGLSAETAWEKLEERENTTLILCRPKTGRTHQIRVHMQSVGHPILGDTQYCRGFKSKAVPKHYLLHAWKVKFVHPITGEELEIEALLPEWVGEITQKTQSNFTENHRD